MSLSISISQSITHELRNKTEILVYLNLKHHQGSPWPKMTSVFFVLSISEMHCRTLMTMFEQYNCPHPKAFDAKRPWHVWAKLSKQAMYYKSGRQWDDTDSRAAFVTWTCSKNWPQVLRTPAERAEIRSECLRPAKLQSLSLRDLSPTKKQLRITRVTI